MKIVNYDTDLTDAQWKLLKPMLPQRNKRGRPPTDPRLIINAILYIVKGGIPWRLLPANFPPWKTVYHVFRKWTVENVWEALNARLRAHVRKTVGKGCRPTGAILDSQSVKSDAHGGAVGFDAAKRIKGRKRHLLVDTMGLILALVVHSAGIQDRDGAQAVFAQARSKCPRLEKVWADGGYAGQLVAWVDDHCAWELEIVKRSDDVKGFKLIPKRWVSERTFGWLNKYRLLSKEYEVLIESSEADIYLAMTHVMVRRLAPAYAIAA